MGFFRKGANLKYVCKHCSLPITEYRGGVWKIRQGTQLCLLSPTHRHERNEAPSGR